MNTIFSGKTLRRGLAALALTLGLSAAAQAQVMCVWDPLGSQGDYSNMLRDYQLAAKRWGVNLDLKVYTDEAKSAEAFKNGECDIANMLGVRARLLNSFTSTIEAPGTIDNYAQLREVLTLLNTDKAEKYMTNGDYEVVGIVPMGAGYPFVDQRKMQTMEGVVGTKMAVMSWDPLQTKLVQGAGVVPVPMDMIQFGPAFNSGKVDMVILPMVLLKPLELVKGMMPNGGIVHRPALQFTMQIVTRKSRFPDGFGHNSREYMLSQMAFALGVIHNAEVAVDQKLWLYATTGELKEYNKSMRDTRTRLTDQGLYDRRMLGILKRIRCKTRAPDDPDCTGNQD